jgi:hypothetical protein
VAETEREDGLRDKKGLGRKAATNVSTHGHPRKLQFRYGNYGHTYPKLA